MDSLEVPSFHPLGRRLRRKKMGSGPNKADSRKPESGNDLEDSWSNKKFYFGSSKDLIRMSTKQFEFNVTSNSMSWLADVSSAFLLRFELQ